MACNTCKKQKDNEKLYNKIEDKVNEENKRPLKKAFHFLIKITLFFTLLIFLTPLVLIGYLVALFNMVILSKGTNIVPVLYFIATKILKMNKDDDDDEDDEDDDEFDDDEFSEDEYELENNEDIIVLK